jgi:hypothetical protein
VPTVKDVASPAVEDHDVERGPESPTVTCWPCTSADECGGITLRRTVTSRRRPSCWNRHVAPGVHAAPTSL